MKMGHSKIIDEYDITLDSRKRVTLKCKPKYSRYHVKIFKSGVVVMVPQKIVVSDDISENTLNMIYSSIRSLNAGKVSEPLDLKRIKKDVQ